MPTELVHSVHIKLGKHSLKVPLLAIEEFDIEGEWKCPNVTICIESVGGKEEARTE